MKTETKSKIIEFIKKNWHVSVKQIKEKFPINTTIIHRHLKSLIDDNILIKIGKTPHVLYMIATSKSDEALLGYEDREWLDKNYYNYDSDGRVLDWYEWFVSWCTSRKFDIQDQCNKYKSICSYIKKKKNDIGLINWKKYLTDKLWKIYIDELYFIDPYQIWHFGRSKLWTITFYAKQSQNKDLIKQVLHIIKYPILSYIKQNNIDAVCFVPPSIKRWVQLMAEIKKWLKIEIPELKLIKMFPSGVIIPQKSLKSMEQRKKNAENTIFISPNQKSYNKVLLIDDFMWSWSTINACAKKLIENKLAKKVEAISLLGNVDTEYDVINEI